MKPCTRCGVKKDHSSFQIRTASGDGLSAACKACLSEYEKSRSNLPHRVKARKDYSATPRGREATSRAKRRYTERNPNKRRAHIMVGNAIRDGKLIKGLCEVCHSPKVVAHHDDYKEPMAVRWLCPAHHAEWHKVNGEAKNP